MKKLYIYILALLCCTACSSLGDYAFRKTLTMASEKLNAQCPMDVHYGTLQRIYLDHDTLCTLLRLADSYSYILNSPLRVGGVPEGRVGTNPSPLAAAMLLALAEDTTQTRLADLARDLAAHGYYLRLRLDPGNSPSKVGGVPAGGGGLNSLFLYASPALLDSVFNDRYTVRQKADIRVQTQVLFAKCRIPIRLDENMSMTAIDYTPGEVRMAYTIVEDEQVNLGNEAFRTTAELVVRRRIWNDLIRSKSPAVQEIVKNYYLSGCSIVYTCTGDKSGGQVTLVFTTADLRMLLSHYGIHI